MPGKYHLADIAELSSLHRVGSPKSTNRRQLRGWSLCDSGATLSLSNAGSLSITAKQALGLREAGLNITMHNLSTCHVEYLHSCH